MGYYIVEHESGNVVSGFKANSLAEAVERKHALEAVARQHSGNTDIVFVVRKGSRQEVRKVERECAGIVVCPPSPKDR
jgi:transposase-like protein